jgi:hypothetical protein
MTKKLYMKPAIQDMGIMEESALLAFSVQTTGLGDDNLNYDDSPGDTWTDAKSRRGNWDE